MGVSTDNGSVSITALEDPCDCARGDWTDTGGASMDSDLQNTYQWHLFTRCNGDIGDTIMNQTFERDPLPAPACMVNRRCSVHMRNGGTGYGTLCGCASNIPFAGHSAPHNGTSGCHDRKFSGGSSARVRRQRWISGIVRKWIVDSY